MINLPLRPGKFNKHVILDSKGVEVLKFPRGSDKYAKEFCHLYNYIYLKRKS